LAAVAVRAGAGVATVDVPTGAVVEVDAGLAEEITLPAAVRLPQAASAGPETGKAPGG